ncbi:MAG: hypothetical protein G3I10_01330 [Ferrovum sp.]|nr:hypothetical protein [Ferrovum sp.]
MEYLIRELVMDAATTGSLFGAEEYGACTDTQTDGGNRTDMRVDGSSNFLLATKSRTTYAGLSRFNDLERELERALSQNRNR